MNEFRFDVLLQIKIPNILDLSIPIVTDRTKKEKRDDENKLLQQQFLFSTTVPVFYTFLDLKSLLGEKKKLP